MVSETVKIKGRGLHSSFRNDAFVMLYLTLLVTGRVNYKQTSINQLMNTLTFLKRSL